MTLHSVPQQQQHFNKQSSVPLLVPGRPRPVAFLNGRTLKKGIQPSHILNKPRAICFDATVIDQAEAAGAITIRVTCENTTYTTDMERFRRYAFPVCRNAGRQLGMELCRWSVDGAEPVQDARERQQAARDSQLGLFAMGGAA